jgi:hypothetical protein
MAHPASMANTAEIIATAENSTGHGVPVAKAFCYPSIIGTGTNAVALVLTPSSPLGSRLPSAGQLTAVGAFIQATLGVDDGLFMLETHAQLLVPKFTLSWAQSAAQWADVVPWPKWGANLVYVTAATATATSFTLYSSDTTVTGSPTVGKTLALWDKDTATFVKKRILSFTTSAIYPAASWVITVDQTADSSNLEYVPKYQQVPGPWSDSLNTLTATIQDYYRAMGPGENTTLANVPISTARCRRDPVPDSKTWPNRQTNKIANEIGALDSVTSCTMVQGDNTATYTGTTTVYVNLLTLDDISIFAE